MMGRHGGSWDPGPLVPELCQGGLPSRPGHTCQSRHGGGGGMVPERLLVSDSQVIRLQVRGQEHLLCPGPVPAAAPLPW